MAAAQTQRLTAQGMELDVSAEAFGPLRSSRALQDNFDALRARMREDGYLYLPGYLDREEVREVRRELINRLEAAGCLDEACPAGQAIARPGRQGYFKPELAQDNPSLMRLLYSGRMMEFYSQLLDGPVRHFDYTWLRSVGPGGGTAPHCDIVYMGRGTTNLFTAWTPLGDVTYEVGGLMILEGSHKNQRLREGYGRKDVDTHCENHNNMRSTGNSGFGALSFQPARLRERLGGRWLSAEFRMGDLLTFSMYTVHASLDNQSQEIRLSTDTRYQLASEPADERWIGENPIAHGEKAKRSHIC